jgi:hypothetical protein
LVRMTLTTPSHIVGIRTTQSAPVCASALPEINRLTLPDITKEQRHE